MVGSSSNASGTLLERMIKNGPRRFHFNEDELKKLLDKGAEVFLNEPSLLEVGIILFSDPFLFCLGPDSLFSIWRFSRTIQVKIFLICFIPIYTPS